MEAGGRFGWRRDEMPHELSYDVVEIGQPAGAQAQYELEGPARPAALADVVDDHEPVVQADDMRQEGFQLGHELLIQRFVCASHAQLLDQGRQALGENDVRCFGVLVLVVVQQLDEE